jgi:alkylation response protein AidB-like acyl-CoA dehydrogenase
VISGSCGPVLGDRHADPFILPIATPGGELGAAVDRAGLDVSPLAGLDLSRPLARVRADRLAVPAGRVLTGLSRPAVASLAATLGAAEACGIADWAVHTAAGYARTRHQFGRPIGQFQAVKHLSGTEPGATGSVRKVLGMRHAQEVAEFCWAVQGPAGALGEAHWARQVLLTRALTIGGGTTDIQLNIVGERILGLPRDPAPPGG